MFFMIGLFPKNKLLKSMFLTNPTSRAVESADIMERGNQLVLFFVPIWTFSKEFYIQFSDGTVCQILNMTKDQIENASRIELEKHLQVIGQQPAAVICPHCRRQVDPGYRYCPWCGEDLGNR